MSDDIGAKKRILVCWVFKFHSKIWFFGWAVGMRDDIGAKSRF